MRERASKINETADSCSVHFPPLSRTVSEEWSLVLPHDNEDLRYTSPWTRDSNIQRCVTELPVSTGGSLAGILQHLPNDLRSLLVRREQLLAFLPLGLDVVVLVQKLLEQVLLVQLADEAVLHDVFGVIDQQVHDRLGHLVGDGLADDIEVRRDETPDQFCLESFALCEGWCFWLVPRLCYSVSSASNAIYVDDTTYHWRAVIIVLRCVNVKVILARLGHKSFMDLGIPSPEASCEVRLDVLADMSAAGTLMHIRRSRSES